LETALRRSRNLLGDVAAANQALDELHNLKNQMRSLLPDRGEVILKHLATHPDVELRICACADLLSIDEPFALSELRKIENSDTGFASLTAKYTISEWRSAS